ncbi:phage tail collar domain-conataing protein [Calothrix sp. NIES-2100]|uniref:tail fiber protein n=1 Tax=Calothrix sp. NIES-2100 TaxID=1954172 RepID=UPI000B5FD00A|nr:phage tail collar domain-conataing protein [Calothrix sp. NIES-2100]
MTRQLFQDGDIFYAEDANQIAYPIPDGQDYIGHGPKINDNYLDDGNDQIKSRFYNFYDRLKVSHSSGLTFSYLGGSILLSSGNIVTISAGSINLPDNSNVYIYVGSNGTVQQSSVLPNESFPLARVTTASGALSGNITDLRDKLVDRITPATIPITQVVPTGMMVEYAGNLAPTGWLLCDGTEYQINSYPALYAAIGANYGGNGTTTFRVPDRRGRVGVGAGQGTGLTNRTVGQTGGQETVILNVSQIPSHNHGVNDPGHIHAISDPGHIHGVIDPGHSHKIRVNRNDGTGNYVADSNGGNQFIVTNDFDALTSGTNISIARSGTGLALSAASTGITTNTQGGNGSHENMPPFIVLNFIIKS